jgi:protocatechuate 3,4-dioxygenase beta subunit
MHISTCSKTVTVLAALLLLSAAASAWAAPGEAASAQLCAPLAPAAAAGSTVGALIGERLTGLERSLEARLSAGERLAGTPAAPSREKVAADADRLQRHLRFLDGQIATLDAGEARFLGCRSRVLSLRAGNLRLLAERRAAAREGRPAPAAPSAAPRGATGGISGTVTRAATGAALGNVEVDIWTQSGFFWTSTYTGPSGSYSATGLGAGTYFATTSNYAGFIDELYDDIPCPGGPTGGCIPVTGTPIVVSSGQVSGGIDFALTLGGVISGRVREGGTGVALPSLRVEIRDAAGAYVGSRYTDVAGRYTMGGLVGGTYFAIAHSSEHRDELYDDIPCPSGCDPTTGTPIAVVTSVTTSGINFVLDRWGSISGTVVESGTGDPVPFLEVEIWGDAGQYVTYGYTDVSGHYRAGGLGAGTYFATTYSYTTYVNELYDDIPCPGGGFGGCDPTTGTPIAVTFNAETVGIDFALEKLGTLSGTVTDATAGMPLSSVYIDVWDSSGSYAGSTYSDATGHYTTDGLSDGTYFVTTASSSHLDELYDDIPCAGGGFGGCDPTTGTPVAVALGADTGGIDFALEKLGTISGAVTDAATGDPLASVGIYIFDSSGSYAGSTYTNGTGHFTSGGLLDGSYFAYTDSSSYLDELYDDIPCPGSGYPSCSPTTGTPIPVALNTETGGIDFALEKLGTVSGTVTDAVTGEPLDSVPVYVWNSLGSYAGSGYSDASGHYRTSGLPGGTYFATTESYSYSNELYDDIPCPGTCTVTSGTPIAVTLNAETGGIDFALDKLGTISGTVTDAATGEPIGSGVYVWNSMGYVENVGTDSLGRYRTGGLPDGSYFVTTESYSTYIDELYDDVPCPGGGFGGCDPTTGTPVPVALNSDAEGIDFALDFGSGIAGTVADLGTGAPLAGVAIDVWDSLGAHVTATATDALGHYRIGLFADSYYVSTDNGQGFRDEIYDNVPCPLGPAFAGLCDPTTGTPVVVQNDQPAVPGIDFALVSASPQIFSDGFESGDLSAWSAAVGN